MNKVIRAYSHLAVVEGLFLLYTHYTHPWTHFWAVQVKEKVCPSVSLSLCWPVSGCGRTERSSCSAGGWSAAWPHVGAVSVPRSRSGDSWRYPGAPPSTPPSPHPSLWRPAGQPPLPAAPGDCGPSPDASALWPASSQTEREMYEMPMFMS